MNKRLVIAVLLLGAAGAADAQHAPATILPGTDPVTFAARAALPEKPEAVADLAAQISQAPSAPQQPSAPAAQDSQPAAPPATHRFWDRRNAWLFAGVAAVRALDFHSTGNMRRRGREEILLTNELVDNKPAFAAVEAGGVFASIGLSYLFHRTGHHRLERWVSYLHIGVGFFGSARNYALRSARPAQPAAP